MHFRTSFLLSQRHQLQAQPRHSKLCHQRSSSSPQTCPLSSCFRYMYLCQCQPRSSQRRSRTCSPHAQTALWTASSSTHNRDGRRSVESEYSAEMRRILRDSRGIAAQLGSPASFPGSSRTSISSSAHVAPAMVDFPSRSIQRCSPETLSRRDEITQCPSEYWLSSNELFQLTPYVHDTEYGCQQS